MNRFSQDPSPVTPGKKVKICYDFDGLSITSASATPSWDPAGLQPASLEFTTEKPCVTFTVPANCQGCILEDDTGYSEDFLIDLI